MNSSKFIFLVVCLRNLYISIFKKKILLIEKNNIVINNYKLLFLTNYINLKYLLRVNKYNIIYELDNLIFYDEHKTNNKLNITSIIILTTISTNYITTYIKTNDIKTNDIKTNDITNNYITTDITKKIKKYTMNVPLFVIIKLEKLDIDNIINFKVLKQSKIVDISYKLKDIAYKKLFELI